MTDTDLWNALISIRTQLGDLAIAVGHIEREMGKRVANAYSEQRKHTPEQLKMEVKT